MRKRFAVAVLSIIVLSSLAVLGSQPEYVRSIFAQVAAFELPSIFSASQPKQNDDKIKAIRASELVKSMGKSRLSKKSKGFETGTEKDIPEDFLWHIAFDFAEKLRVKSEEARSKGESDLIYSDYFIREGDLSRESVQILKENARDYALELEPNEQETLKTLESLKSDNIEAMEFIGKYNERRKEIVLGYRDRLRERIGEPAYADLVKFLSSDFLEGSTSSPGKMSVSPEGIGAIGISWIIWTDGSPITVTGFSQLFFYYVPPPWIAHPSLDSFFINDTTNTLLDSGRGDGIWTVIPAQYLHPTFFAALGQTYCTITDHYAEAFVLRSPLPETEIYLGTSGICVTFVPLPPPATPTPVPTPRCTSSDGSEIPCPVTPTPTPTPTPCDPLGVLPCQTPTPTPSPTPTPIQIEVNTVGFDGDYSIRKFPSGDLIADPTWTKGSPANAENVVSYKKGTETTALKLSASFTVSPAPGQPLNAKVRVKYNGNVIATTSNSVPFTGNTFSIQNLQPTSALEATPKVKKGNYIFAWEVTVDDGQTWLPARSSEHIIYWTYGDVAVEPPSCDSDLIKRNCLFVNEWGDRDWPGLYDKALDKAIAELDSADQTPEQIAKRLAFNIDDQINYNTGTFAGDMVHPLSAYISPDGVQCSVNANLLRGLLRSIGINNSETVYVWGGKPNNTDRREDETGGSTYWYQFRNTSSITGGVTAVGYVTFQAIRPESNDGTVRLQKDPHFNFHAMVKVFNEPDGGVNNLNARYYDPSYAKRLQANPGRYSDYPYINNDLKFKLAANLDDTNPGNHRYVANDASKPYIVRALRKNICFPIGSPPPCSNPNTKVKTGVRDFTVAAAPRTSVFDDQGVATFTVWRSDGGWHSRNSYADTYRYASWGLNGDKPMPGDYDGDGFTDYAVFRPSDSTVYILESDSQTFRTFVWNSATDKAVYGDFDGDGISDIAFYRSDSQVSQWFINRSSDGVTYSLNFGNSLGVPVSGDFDGDGKTDVAMYTRDGWGTWIWMDADGEMNSWETDGQSTDIPVPGDYDGDGKTDFALYRPSDHYWQILYSNKGTSQFYLGVTGDIPVPGDYDGDGKTDVALWSPSNGRWLVKNSSDGTTMEDYWGGQSYGDVPVAASYIY